MEKEHTPTAVQAISAVVASAKQDRVKEQEDIPTPPTKKPEIQDQQPVKVAWSGYIYGLYVQESVLLNNPPLDFITFEAALPGDIEFLNVGRSLEQCMPMIRAVEEKLKLASSKLSASEKITKLESALDVIKTTLPDLERTSLDRVKQLTTIVDGLFLSTLTSVDYCRPLLKEHTSAMKKNLATTEALRDSLGLDSQQKKSMQQVVDGLEMRVDMAEKLEGLFQK